MDGFEREQGVLTFEGCFSEAMQEENSRVVKNVLLCGNKSLNGYDIPSSAFVSEEHVKRLYEDKPVYLNHRKPGERNVQDFAGVITNVTLRDGKPFGDVDTTDCPGGAIFQSLVRKRRRGIGLSHVAHYERSAYGRTVNRVSEVASVDAVVGPATTKTFFEQAGMQMDDLRPELDTVRKERDELKSKYATLEAEKNTLASKVTALESDKAGLEKAQKDLTLEVESFKAEKAVAARRANVESALKEAGLDPADKELVSESFMEALVGEKDDAKRASLIGGISALAKKVPAKESHNGGARERQNQPDAKSKGPSYEDLVKSLKTA